MDQIEEDVEEEEGVVEPKVARLVAVVVVLEVGILLDLRTVNRNKVQSPRLQKFLRARSLQK